MSELTPDYFRSVKLSPYFREAFQLSRVQTAYFQAMHELIYLIGNNVGDQQQVKEYEQAVKFMRYTLEFAKTEKIHDTDKSPTPIFEIFKAL